MPITRRSFIRGTGAIIAASASGCDCGKNANNGERKAHGERRGATAAPDGRPEPAVEPHYVVLVTLRGGFDSIMSVDPKDQSKVGENIACGYRYDECVRGSERLFGPLAGGLERVDSDLCLIHGVRSDTTAHPDGLQMLMRGSIGARPGPVAPALAAALAGDAPLANLDMMALDGKAVFEEGVRPSWSDLRAKAHQSQIAELKPPEPDRKALAAAYVATASLEKFLHDASNDAAALDGQFEGFLGRHFRLAFQAIRGNWAKCVSIGSRMIYFDSHSDNFRFQTERQPATWSDLVAFVDLLKAERNRFGTLFDQTTIAVFSEFGRYPRLNAEGGKDHWPENSWVLLGKGVKKGATVGGTDDRMRGMKINFTTGLAKEDGRPIFLDNAFATLAKLAGGEPTNFGYQKDAVMDCVLG